MTSTTENETSEKNNALRSGVRLIREILAPLPDYRMKRALDEVERLVGHPIPWAAVRDRMRMALGEE
jgi:hypothetical protein